MEDLLIGFVMGLLGLLFPNARMLNMIKGNIGLAVLLHVLSSILWAFSIYFAAQLNIKFILGNIAGGCISIYYLTKKQQENK